MAKFTFADRYAEAGLSPSSQTVLSRLEPANRIIYNIANDKIIELVSFYYGDTNVDLHWLRDEFVKEDASFSLVNNERETLVLASLILSELIQNESRVTILAVSAGSVRGLRQPSQSIWLLKEAEEALARLSVTDRNVKKIATKITPTSSPKNIDELTALSGTNDFEALVTLLGKVRTEALSSTTATAKQITVLFDEFNRQASLAREESQMLWWLIGGYSRTFERSFANFTPSQTAIVSAVDLGTLTTSSILGPIAIPAMLEKIIGSSKKTKGTPVRELAAVVDSFTIEELGMLDISNRLPARLTPITSSVLLAKAAGLGAWHSRFNTETGLEASIQLEPIVLAEQLYREYLLGRLV